MLEFVMALPLSSLVTFAVPFELIDVLPSVL